MLPFVSEQLAVIRWHRVEQGRLVALDLRIHVRRAGRPRPEDRRRADREGKDRKSTRLNSSHVSISYAVFCLKKKKEQHQLLLSTRPDLSRLCRPRKRLETLR